MGEIITIRVHNNKEYAALMERLKEQGYHWMSRCAIDEFTPGREVGYVYLNRECMQITYSTYKVDKYEQDAITVQEYLDGMATKEAPDYSAKADEDKPAPDYSAKADAGKPELCLVPTQIIWDIAAIRSYGTKKYGDPDNWKKVDPQRYRNAAFRHFLKYIEDPESVDEESGLLHRQHLECNLAFLAELEKR